MANYKTANQLPILEEVTENTFALVEENGSLKRVSGSNLGGKSNCCVISIDYSNAAAPSSVESTDPSGVVCTCNMDYNELLEVIQNKTLNGFHIYEYAPDAMRITPASKIYFERDYLDIIYDAYYGTGELYFNSDNTISAGSGDS